LILKDKDFRPAFVFDDADSLLIKRATLDAAGAHAHIVLKDVANYTINYPQERTIRIK
jgi:hypothetical protein